MYGNDRRGAYLHVVDTARWAVWAAEGPVPVDTESWTLALWLAQERGLRWHTTIGDGGAAIEAAIRTVDPTGQHRRDVWHVLHVCAQVQGRLDRRVTQVEAQTASDQRQATRIAAGQRPLGRNPRTDLVAHLAGCAQARATAVRASSAVVNWHSILRPHLAVHRVLSPGLLALLVVWHNHHAFARGPHAGVSPLHLSGMTDAPTDWLVAIGYPPLDAPASAPPLVQALPVAA